MLLYFGESVLKTLQAGAVNMRSRIGGFRVILGREVSFKGVMFLNLLLTGANVLSQSGSANKQVTSFTQSWVSFNSTLRFSNHWGMVADVHMRRDDLISDPYFYFLRTGVSYWISGKYPVILGVGHLWQAPLDGDSTWSDENRIYQQWSAVQKQGFVSVQHRIRLEQRWKDPIVNDEIVGDKRFSVRLRYLASFDFRVLPNPKYPSLVLSDEVLVQFGKYITYNTFDQNRLFIGLKEQVSRKLSFDAGYMNIWQQKSSGNQYTMSHVIRLFLYYNLNFVAD